MLSRAFYTKLTERHVIQQILYNIINYGKHARFFSSQCVSSFYCINCLSPMYWPFLSVSISLNSVKRSQRKSTISCSSAQEAERIRGFHVPRNNYNSSSWWQAFKGLLRRCRRLSGTPSAAPLQNSELYPAWSCFQTDFRWLWWNAPPVPLLYDIKLYSTL